MKSIKNFEDKKIENMSNIQGGLSAVTKKSTFSNRDRYYIDGASLKTNSSWFRPSDQRWL